MLNPDVPKACYVCVACRELTVSDLSGADHGRGGCSRAARQLRGSVRVSA